MAKAWFDVTKGGAPRREVLEDGLTVIGGEDGGIPIPASGADRLHVWSEPPKLIFVGQGEGPRVNGLPVQEAELRSGDRIEWAGAELVYGEPEKVAALEEVPIPPPMPASSAATAPADLGLDQDAWDRVKAGILVEVGLADRGAAKRWQEAVKRNEFDPTACAREILSRSQVPLGDPKVRDRAGRLERDLLMQPLLRGVQGASRRVRTQAKGGAAFLISQAMAIGVYTVLVVVAAILARMQWDWSFDEHIDSVLGIFGRGESEGS